MGFNSSLSASSSITFYSANDSIVDDRTVDMDGNFVKFENGSFFQIDDAENGFYYGFSTERVGIGNDAPLSKLHITGNAGEDSILAEVSDGTDVFWVDSNGVMYSRSTGGTENIVVRSTGGNTCRIRNNSNQFTFTSTGLLNLETGNGAGAGIVVAGYLSGNSTYTVDQRRIQLLANFNNTTEIVYADFRSDTGVQTAVFGSSDAEESRYDQVTWYTEQFVLDGIDALDYADDTAASAGGVPVAGVYHTSGTLKIRLI